MREDELKRLPTITPADKNRQKAIARIIPDRGELARRLLGAGQKYAPERDAVAELVEERAQEG